MYTCCVYLYINFQACSLHPSNSKDYLSSDTLSCGCVVFILTCSFRYMLPLPLLASVEFQRNLVNTHNLTNTRPPSSTQVSSAPVLCSQFGLWADGESTINPISPPSEQSSPTSASHCSAAGPDIANEDDCPGISGLVCQTVQFPVFVGELQSNL